MNKQLTTDDIQRLRGEIGAALVALRRGDGDDYPRLSEYAPWASPAQVPMEKLERLAADLKAEARLRQTMDDEAYYCSRTVEGTIALYLHALAGEGLPALTATLAALGYKPGSNVPKAVFRRALGNTLASVNGPVPEPGASAGQPQPTTQDTPDGGKAPPKPKAEKPKPQKGGGKRPPAKKRGVGKAARPVVADNPPTVEMVEEYMRGYVRGKAKQYNPMAPELFVCHYAENEWNKNDGKPLLDWKGAAAKWIMRDMAYFSPNAKQQYGRNSVPTGPSVKPEDDIMANAREYAPMGRKGAP